MALSSGVLGCFDEVVSAAAAAAPALPAPQRKQLMDRLDNLRGMFPPGQRSTRRGRESKREREAEGGKRERERESKWNNEPQWDGAMDSKHVRNVSCMAECSAQWGTCGVGEMDGGESGGRTPSLPHWAWMAA